MLKIPLFLIPIVVWVVIQLMKLIIDLIIEKKLKLHYLWRSWGFPSVHSGISSSLCVIVLILSWYDSVAFAITLTFSFLVRYDAVNVRYEAGKHAKYINDITIELRDLFKVGQNFNLLKERLGHTIVEVLGGIIMGSILTFVLLFLSHSIIV